MQAPQSTAPDPGKGVSPSRRHRIEAARDVWIARLMDTTRRNNLLYFRDLQTGTLDLSAADEGALRRLFNGEKVPLSRLVPQGRDAKAGVKLREIVRKAQANLEEKGLQTLFVAYGMASWPVADDGRPPEAAIVLLPIEAEGRRSDPDSMVLHNSGTPQANIALLHSLSEDHGIVLQEDDLINTGLREDEGFDPELICQHLRELTVNLKGFEVHPRVVIGNFSFQKLAMVKDLREGTDLLAGHDMVAALSGDPDARTALGGRRISIEPHALDSIPPGSEFMVLDADSSQQTVVHAVASDLDGVIQGPPGCGKSQTIANVIATLVASGKRVLFVAEKRAALEAVYKRLHEKGLGHLALDLHGAAVSQKSVMVNVAAARERIRQASEPDDGELLRRFQDRRSRLVAHAEGMHRPLSPSGLTPYEMQARILEAAKTSPSKTRWRGVDLAKLTNAVFIRVLDVLAEAQGFSTLILRTDSSPWTNAQLNDGTGVQDALDAAQRLSVERLPEERITIYAVGAGASELRAPPTVGQLERFGDLISETNDFLAEWKPEIFQDASLLPDLAPVGRGSLATLWASLTSLRYRSAKRRGLSYSKKGETRVHVLWQSAQLAESLCLRWRDSFVHAARPIEVPDEVLEAHRLAAADISVLKAALPGFESLPIDQLLEVTRSLVADERSARAIPTVRKIESELAALGVHTILAEFRVGEISPEHWLSTFKHAYYSSCYDAARVALPDLAAFRGDSHNQFASEFRRLDQDRMQIAAVRVKREHAERAIQVMNALPQQTQLITAEAAKRSRHLPLRRVVAQAGEVLTAICPCWMSSPLNVSQLLPVDSRLFDVVVFDEASQVLPEDAICSILRGKRLVIAGDRYQLPPTSFFADGAAEEDEEAPTSGFESLLDQMSAFVDHWPLDWHYRSRDERLIAFSNRHIYGNRLTTFPGIGGLPAISHILVDGLPRDGDEESCSAEVERVVQLILQHAEMQAGRDEADRESLGVIAFGIRHSDRVQASLDRALEVKRHLAEFLDTSKDNPWFFLKNLERVQGDERDAIILSVGYGKDRTGRLPYRFGPLLREGGERRLNVAITRAKRSITVVSSFSHTDMDPRRSDRKGVELLRLFLQFAASGGTNLGDIGGTGEPMNAFEADIHDALSQRGIPLVPQYGVSSYRLDFAAMHPEREGEFVLALECDGASYHSAPTARDRDRLRQQQLEARGWLFHRIWSTDWFLKREEQIERACSAWREAVQVSDRRRDKLKEEQFGGLLSPVPLDQLKADSIDSEEPRQSARGPKPDIPILGDIELYRTQTLVELVKWIESDGLLRTDEEVVSEMVPLLGFRRKGPRIVAALERAIKSARS